MRRCSSVLEVADKILMSIVIAFLVSALTQPVLAKDAGITIQTTLSSSYGHTRPLGEPILKRLKASADTNDKSKIRKVLSQLRDGDILVLAVHSNPTIFAIGDVRKTGKIKWDNFWSHFGIEKPPKLAAVIIAGCMDSYYEVDKKKYTVPITGPELDSMRRSLNTWTLFVPKTAIGPCDALVDADYCLRSILSGTNLSEIDLVPSPKGLEDEWHLVTDPKLDPDKISLFELRVIGKQLFQESDANYLVPVIRPTEVTGKGVSGPPTLESIQDQESEVWGAWGATQYAGYWDFGPEEYHRAYGDSLIVTRAYVDSFIVTFIRPERAKEFFEYTVRNLRAYFAKEDPYRIDAERIDGARKRHPDRKIYGEKGRIHEEPNRLTIFFPADDYNICKGEDRIVLLYNKNTVINVESVYFHFIVKEKVSQIVKEMETGAMIAVDSALERAEVQLKQ